jgi:hypothetical protein
MIDDHSKANDQLKTSAANDGYYAVRFDGREEPGDVRPAQQALRQRVR